MLKARPISSTTSTHMVRQPSAMTRSSVVNRLNSGLAKMASSRAMPTVTVLQARAVANDMPDIVTFPYNNSDLAYARDGFYMDLTNEAFMQENVTPAALESNKIDGVNYFLPYISNAYGVYYNVDIFEENGIEIPTTMDELYAACEKLQAAAGKVFYEPALFRQAVQGVYGPDFFPVSHGPADEACSAVSGSGGLHHFPDRLHVRLQQCILFHPNLQKNLWGNAQAA